MRSSHVAVLMGVACTFGALLLGAGVWPAIAMGSVPLVLGMAAVRVELGYLFATLVLLMGVMNLAFPFATTLAQLIERLTK